MSTLEHLQTGIADATGQRLTVRKRGNAVVPAGADEGRCADLVQTVPGVVVATGLEEELSAPFNNDAKFRFFIKNDKNSQGGAPASLGTLRGILLELNGQSEYAPSGASAKKQANFRTAVFFKNRLD